MYEYITIEQYAKWNSKSIDEVKEMIKNKELNTVIKNKIYYLLIPDYRCAYYRNKELNNVR